MIELVERKPIREPSGLRGAGWVVAAFYLFAAVMFGSWAMGVGGPATSGASHHTSMGAAATGTTGAAPAR